MDKRIFVFKKPDFDRYTTYYKTLLPVSFARLRVALIYDIFSISEDLFSKAVENICVDVVTDKWQLDLDYQNFSYAAIEYLPGQYDARADALEQCLQLLDSSSSALIKTGILFSVPKEDDISWEAVLPLLFNPIESRVKDLRKMRLEENLLYKVPPTYEGFITFSTKELFNLFGKLNLSISFEDFELIQAYFIKENRNPTELEIRLFDTYWSDHCRHTTFLTHLQKIEFKGGNALVLENYFQEFLQDKDLIGEKDKPITFMQLATQAAKVLKIKGFLKYHWQGIENNAATIKFPIIVAGAKKEILIFFKNETHNHPTEIEPYGGASTCLGGAIRDPLSGRAWVYQAMRLSGAANPLHSPVLPTKLPQKTICQKAALGFSSYGNQIGISTTQVTEVYHKGFLAKRLEAGFVLGACFADALIHAEPQVGDLIFLLGGATGKDGIGGATGSSKTSETASTEDLSVQVQKGNPVIERQLQRLFNHPIFKKCVKKSNDFGAGGVVVAVGELAPSLTIFLDKIPTKQANLNEVELAISESQERMAVVISPENEAILRDLAGQENVSITQVATVTDSGYLSIFYKNQAVVHIARSFIETNGAVRHTNAVALTIPKTNPFKNTSSFTKQNFLQKLQSLDVCSQKGLIEQFDGTIGRSTVLMPLGGKFQLTPSEGSAHTILGLDTESVSISTIGYTPTLSEWSSLHGGAYAVVESVAKIGAVGANPKEAYFTFQEYFPKFRSPEDWGDCLSALLGAYKAQKEFSCGAIGGKDSMSGSFGELHVPPSLISFAVAVGKKQNICSPEFKQKDKKIYYFKHQAQVDFLPNYSQLNTAYQALFQAVEEQKIESIKTVKWGGLPIALALMSMGNKIGAKILKEDLGLNLEIGSLVVVGEINHPLFEYIGQTSEASELVFPQFTVSVEEIIEANLPPLQSIYPLKTTTETEENGQDLPLFLGKSVSFPQKITTQPTVFIPVFSGTNCEFDTQKAFEEAGAKVAITVLKNTTPSQRYESVKEIAKQIRNAEVFCLAGGFSAGDEPDGSAKYITHFLKNEYINEAIVHLLEKKGLILGICNGFQALIKSGLLPYGKVVERLANQPTLATNANSRHISQMVTIKVISEITPWLASMGGKRFTVPISHGEGRIIANEDDYREWVKRGQIGSVYIDENPNGSKQSIESLSSENGLVYGRMGHAERFSKGLFKNIPHANYHDIFKNGVNYFK